MYINRKTGELVEAIYLDDGEFVSVSADGKTAILMEVVDFQAQYSEAMICPDYGKYGYDCTYCEHSNLKAPHIKCPSCEDKPDCMNCIPYTPEQKELNCLDIGNGIPCGNYPARSADECMFCKGKPVKKETLAQSNSQSLLLSDGEIRNILQTGGTPMDFSRAIAESELKHLKGLGIVYVKSETSSCDMVGVIPISKKIRFIPLSDYNGKGEK